MGGIPSYWMLVFGAHPHLRSQNFTQFQVRSGYHAISFLIYIWQKGKHSVISFKQILSMCLSIKPGKYHNIMNYVLTRFWSLNSLIIFFQVIVPVQTSDCIPVLFFFSETQYHYISTYFFTHSARSLSLINMP